MYARIFFVASLLTSIVSAVSIPGLPKCAGDCVGTDFGGCQQLNVQCICSNKPLLTHLACCVSKNCDKADQDKTIQFANAICEGENVTDLPQSATCASTAATGTATASSSANSSAAATAATTTGAGTGTAAGASSASSTSPSVAPASSSGAANAGGIGLGMVVAGLVAAI